MAGGLADKCGRLSVLKIAALLPRPHSGAALGLEAAAQWIANCLIRASFPTLGDFSLGVAYGF